MPSSGAPIWPSGGPHFRGGRSDERPHPAGRLVATGSPVRVTGRIDTPLSRWLWLVKRLLAVPHYFVLALLCGAGTWAAPRTGTTSGVSWPLSGGLIELLAIIAGVVLLVTGRYPRELFDLLVGLQRWVFRVVAHAALMTDTYPPFRLDLGGDDGPPASGPSPLRGRPGAS